MHRALSGQNEQKLSTDGAEQHSPGEASAARPVVEPRTEPLPVPGRERLTPEERRQLRRDINAAGRDIYRRTRTE